MLCLVKIFHANLSGFRVATAPPPLALSPLAATLYLNRFLMCMPEITRPEEFIYSPPFRIIISFLTK